MHNQLLETDQTGCYSKDGRPIPCQGAGQDASNKKRTAILHDHRFQLLDHVVKDELTGTIWCRNANPAEFPLTWNEGIEFVRDMCVRKVHGFSNWQLPTRSLLFSLISHQNINPSLQQGHPFQNVFSGYYWTSETCRRLPDQGWYIHLGGGRIHRGMKHGSYMLWPVSPGQKEATHPIKNCGSRFSTNDGCVQDHLTGLAWSQNANLAKTPHTWEEAILAVNELNRLRFGGHGDWRLPNIRELESLVDLQSHSPALPEGNPFFNVRDAYWSSTTSVYEPRYAWTVYFQDGIVGVGFKPGNDFYVWPVRTYCQPDE